MTSENASLVRDTKAMVRESMHVRRSAGWADVASQLCTALERSDEIRESLETKVQELTAELERAHARRKSSKAPQPLPVLDEAS